MVLFNITNDDNLVAKYKIIMSYEQRKDDMAKRKEKSTKWKQLNAEEIVFDNVEKIHGMNILLKCNNKMYRFYFNNIKFYRIDFDNDDIETGKTYNINFNMGNKNPYVRINNEKNTFSRSTTKTKTWVSTIFLPIVGWFAIHGSDEQCLYWIL